MKEYRHLGVYALIIKEDKILNHQHIGIFYKVNSYNNEIKKEELFSIAKLELEKLGYTL